MKKIGLILVFLYALCCEAQNYQCLQSGVIHYFTNGNGYLRGIRIDSVHTNGSDSIFYPYKTARQSSIIDIDTPGGSWLGNKVIMQPNGTFLFDDIRNDTITIKSKANIYDSWIFYKDASAKYYKATVIAIDTMTVLGFLDSVKTICINAYDSTVLDTNNRVNNFKILLSKNHGFVKVFDLYTFPYPTLYPLDYFFDQATNTTVNFTYPPVNFYNAEHFNLINFHIPTLLEIYNYSVGDYFEKIIRTEMSGYSFILGCPSDIPYYTGMETDSILTHTIIDPYHIQYTYQHKAIETDYAYEFSTDYTHTETDRIDTVVYDTSLLFSSNTMPEEWMVVNSNMYFYIPNSDSCTNSALYSIYPAYIYDYIRVQNIYMKGFGNIQLEIPYLYGISNSCAFYLEEIVYNTLIYSIKSGISCGSLDTFSLSVVNSNPQKLLKIFPNPTTSTLNISSPIPITKINITNLIGQTLLNQSYNSDNVQIDVSKLPKGIYFLKINGTVVQRFVKY